MVIERCERCLGNLNCREQVVEECVPVRGFGDIESKKVQVVTVGLNPALNEWYQGENLKAARLRLGALSDYRVNLRTDLKDADVADLVRRRKEYFRNVDREWHAYFEKLDSVLARINPEWSYAIGSAVHLDLVACATKERWGKLNQACVDALLENCRHHFIEKLKSVRSGAVILMNGATAVREMVRVGVQLKESGGKQLVNIRNTMGYVGTLELEGRTYECRGWSTQAGQMSALWRFDLAYWVFGTLYAGKVWPGSRAQRECG